MDETPASGEGERTAGAAAGASTLGEPRPGPRTRVEERDEHPPARIGRFQILRVHGAGGMGFVYVGRDEQLRREVAIKVLRSERNSERNRARLEREAAALAQLSHPNVVPVFEVGDHEGQLFIAMELIDGDNLRSWLRNGDRTWREIVDVFLQAARGLAAAHARGLVHRDFKPENALLGSDGRVRVVDFGVVAESDGIDTASDAEDPIAASDDELRTRTGEFLGTPRYMAPEQFVGLRVGTQADQFAWCVALYEALSHERPFLGGNVSELASAVTEGRAQPLPRGTYPRTLADVLARGMARQPGDRWPDMHGLVAAVQRATTRRIRWPWLLAGAGLVAGGVALFVSRPPPADVVADPPAAPTSIPVRLAGPPTDMQARAQEAFVAGHAALERGEVQAAAQWFDAAAQPFERAQAVGEDLTRIQLDRALAHLAVWRSSQSPRDLVIAHELLRRVADDEYRHPSPAQGQARAAEALAELAQHPVELLAARGTADPEQRFFLQYFGEHPPGTRVDNDGGELCREPCTAAVPVGDATVLRLTHPGYADILFMVRPVHHLTSPYPMAGMHRLAPGERYEPSILPPV